jgi:hypothetical protein
MNSTVNSPHFLYGAVALNWGVFNKKRFEEKPQTIVCSSQTPVLQYAFFTCAPNWGVNPVLARKVHMSVLNIDSCVLLMMQLFYDMGAGSTTATVVEYSYAKPSKSASKVPSLKIKSTAYDRTLGGLEFDLVLRDHLVKVWPTLPLH